MSARPVRASTPLDAVRARVGSREARAAAIVVVVGITMLVLRPFATGEARVFLFAASYLTIGLASIAVPVERDRPRLAPGLALLIGLAAVAISARVAGSPVPLPWSWAALPLSLLAAVAEEALFRRLAYARLERFGALVAIAGLGAAVRTRARACVRHGGAPRGCGRRPALRVAAVGVGDVDGSRGDPRVRERAGGAPMRRPARRSCSRRCS